MNPDAKVFRSNGGGAAVAVAALLWLAGCAIPPTEVPTAQSIRGLKPSGTVTMTQVFVSGTGVGSGALTFKGKAYAFTLIGSLVGLGALSRLDAAGEVFNLSDVSQFSGPYIQGAGRLAVSTSGRGEVWLKNRNGVIMRLAGVQTGVTFTTGRYQIFIDVAK